MVKTLEMRPFNSSVLLFRAEKRWNLKTFSNIFNTSLHTNSICSKEYSGFHSWTQKQEGVCWKWTHWTLGVILRRNTWRLFTSFQMLLLRLLLAPPPPRTPPLDVLSWFLIIAKQSRYILTCLNTTSTAKNTKKQTLVSRHPNGMQKTSLALPHVSFISTFTVLHLLTNLTQGGLGRDWHRKHPQGGQDLHFGYMVLTGPQLCHPQDHIQIWMYFMKDCASRTLVESVKERPEVKLRRLTGQSKLPDSGWKDHHKSSLTLNAIWMVRRTCALIR